MLARVDDLAQRRAERMRALLARGHVPPAVFRAELMAIGPTDRDAWLDRVLAIEDVVADDRALPRGCVPYLPCAVDTIVAAVDAAQVGPSDMFVDVGCGVGRAVLAAHLLTGAAAVGMEIQPALASDAMERVSAMGLERVSFMLGDAVELIERTEGTVFFLYCPFGGERVARTLHGLEAIARTRPIRIAAVDLPLPPCHWLMPIPTPRAELAVYRSAHPRYGDTSR